MISAVRLKVGSMSIEPVSLKMTKEHERMEANPSRRRREVQEGPIRSDDSDGKLDGESI